MRKSIATLCCCVAALVPGPAAAQGAKPPVNIIFDTDIYADLDDLLALAMLHALEDRKEIRLLAVTISTDSPLTARYVGAVDRWYGHGSIPIGLVRDGVTGAAIERRFPWLATQTNYTHYFATLQAVGGQPVHLQDGIAAADAVSLLRAQLAGEPDGSIIIVQAGFSTNLARLLASGPDGASPLDGYELVRRKVRFLSAMAGQFGDVPGMPGKGPHPEFNLLLDVPSAQRLFDRWPTPIVLSGYEVGASMLFKGENVAKMLAYAPDHSVAAAWQYMEPIYKPHVAAGKEVHDHPTFDLTSVLYAARPDGDYFALSKPGTITVNRDGSATFSEARNGNRRYLIVDDVRRARALEAMTSLVTQPPVALGRQ